MEPHSDFDIPLEALTQGTHAFGYTLTDAFFEAFDAELIAGGDFEVKLEVERVRNQFNLELVADGAAKVECGRCLGELRYPVRVEDSVVVKFDADQPRVEENVIFVVYGTERFNVAKVIYDAIGLAMPMAPVHEDIGEECDPEVTRYLDPATAGTEGEADDQSTDQTEGIPEDSPWSALRDLDTSAN